MRSRRSPPLPSVLRRRWRPTLVSSPPANASADRRVIVLPGDGKIEVNGGRWRSSFPGPCTQTIACSAPLRPALRRQRRRPRPRPRRRISGQAGADPPPDRSALDRDRPRAARRLKRRGLPHPRRAREGASQGRPQEGAQAPAVQQALASPLAATERKLFGTDEVQERLERSSARSWRPRSFARATASLVERPQVLIVRDTRESGPMLELAWPPDLPPPAVRPCSAACCRPPPPRSWSAPRPRSRAVSSPPPQSLPNNGIKFFSRAGRSSTTRRRSGSKRCWGGGPDGGPIGRVRELNGGLGGLLARAGVDLPARPRPPQGHPRLRNGATDARAGDLRAARRRGRGDRRRARRAQHQRGLRLDPPRQPAPPDVAAPRRRSAWPSTATPTGCSPSTAPVTLATATS